jgi:hypothetical protein
VWGIGRYLYQLGGIWVQIEQRGKISVIKDNQYAKLEAEYNAGITMMANAPTNGKAPESPVEKSLDKPQTPSSAPATKPDAEPQTAETKTPTLKEKNDQVINEIGGIISTAKNGKAFFSEDEKEQARQVIRTIRNTETGLVDLIDFKDYLSKELSKRESKKAA